jgi:hypothetical protein
VFIKKSGQPCGDMTEQKISECFICKYAGYPGTQVILAGKDPNTNKWNMVETDGSTVHVHKEKKSTATSSGGSGGGYKGNPEQQKAMKEMHDENVVIEKEKLLVQKTQNALYERFIKAYEERNRILSK